MTSFYSPWRHFPIYSHIMTSSTKMTTSAKKRTYAKTILHKFFYNWMLHYPTKFHDHCVCHSKIMEGGHFLPPPGSEGLQSTPKLIGLNRDPMVVFTPKSIVMTVYDLWCRHLPISCICFEWKVVHLIWRYVLAQYFYFPEWVQLPNSYHHRDVREGGG